MLHNRESNGAAGFAAVILLAILTRGSTQQITCYTVPSVAGEFNCLASTPNFQADTIEECCVERNGHFFEGGGDESCQACVVFGFFRGSEILLPEQGESIILEIGFIKGGNVQQLTGIDTRNTARFEITIAGSATEGPNADFTIQPELFEIEGPDARAPFELTTFVRIDGVALEPAEDFILTVEGRNNAGRAIIAPTTPGQFVFPTIRVEIEDVENATLQFTESDYSNPECELFIVPVVQLLSEIATNLTVRIVPINITEVMDRNLESALPTIPPFNSRAPNIATSVDDFSTTPLEFTFPAGEARALRLEPGIEIINDTINEVEQLFALILEVVDAIDPARVDLLGGERFASLARIFDDDPINIGFPQERYTVSEANDTLGELIPIPIIKENDQESELTFEVIATLTLGSGPTAATENIDFEAIPPVQRQDFENFEQLINYVFELFDDLPPVPEPIETFQIQLSLPDEGLTNVNLGASGGNLFATATVFIIDDDDVIIGWEQNVTRVNESQSILELCVRVLNLADSVEFPTGFVVSLAANTIRGTAADPGDYTALVADSDVFFDIIDDDTRRVCIEVVIINDTLLEITEFFSIEVVPDPFVTNFPLNVQLDPALTFVEILDNDFVQIGFNQTEYVVLESDGVVTLYVVVLQGNLQRSVSVTFSTIPGTAAAIFDFLPVIRTLIFDANVRTNAVNITIVNDPLTELEESFRASLTRDPFDLPGEVMINPDNATVRILDDDAVTIGFEQTLYNAAEGVDASVELCAIVREGALAREAIVTFLTTPGSATSDSPADYQGVLQDLTFGPGITRRCVNVTIMNDDIVENTENFFANLTTTDTLLTLDPDVAEVIISEDSSDRVTIGFERLVYNAVEGVNISVELCAVLRMGTLEREAVVDFQTIDDTATSTPPVDYTAASASFTYDAVNNRRCVDVFIENDDILEAQERFLGSLATTDFAVILDPQQTEVLIDEDPNDSVTIGFERTMYNVTEGVDASVELCAVLTSGILEREAVVAFSTSDGTATSGAPIDYAGTAEDLTFDGSTDRNCVIVAITDDDILEDTENFFGTLTTTDSSVTLTPDRAQVNIFEDPNDGVTIGFERTVYTATEGVDASVELCAVLVTGILERQTIVMFSTSDGTATSLAPADYDETIQDLTFDGSTDRNCVNVPIVNDDALEATESFTASLTTSDLAVTLNPDLARVDIFEDPNDSVTIGFERTVYNVTEGVDASVELCAVLTSGTLEREAVVVFSTTDGTATSGAPIDYAGTTEDLTFDGSTDRNCVIVAITDDDILEDTENFFGTLTTTDSSVTLTPDRAQVNIFEDPDDGVTIGFEMTVYTATEGVDATVELCAVLTSGTLEREAVVTFSTSDGTATSLAPADYGETITDLTFDGSTNRNCVNVPIVNDDALEATESFSASLTTSDLAVTLNPNLARVDIFEDPNDSVTIGFERTVYNVTEGVDASVELCAVLTSGILEREAVVVFSTTDGTATSGAPIDYDETTEDLTFDGSTDRNCVIVAITDDDILEDTENFFGTLTTTDSSVTLTPDRAQVNIFEDPDDGVTIGFERTVYNVTEGVDASVELCAVLTSGTLEREAVVTFSTSDGTATSLAPADYGETIADLTFDGSTNRNCVTVPIVNDDALEATESFTASLTTSDLAVTLNPDLARVDIFEDPNDGVTIGFERTVYNVTEGVDASVELCAVLTSGTLEREVVVEFSTSDGTATSGAPTDYDGTIEDLIFDGSTDRNCVTVAITDDDILEDTENFFGTLTTTDSSVTLSPDRAQVNILEDPNDGVTIGFERTVYNVTEGVDTTVELCAVLITGELERQAIVTFSTADDTATSTAPADFGGASVNWIFDDSTTRNCVFVSIENDDILEDTERFFGSLTTTDGAVTLNPDQAQVNIFEDSNDGVTIGFEQTLYVTTEGVNPSVELCAIITAGTLEREAVVRFSTMDGTATSTAPVDYTAVAVDFTFDPGSNRRCVDVSITNDEILEATENFFGDLTTTDPAVTLNPDRARVDINEDPNDGVTIGFEQTLYMAIEGIDLQVQLCAVLTMGVLEREAVVMFFTTDGTAESAAPDYTATTVDFTFGPSVSRQCVNVSIEDDIPLENTETFFGNLATTDAGVTLNPDTARVDIIDAGMIVIGFEQTLYMATEGVDPFVELCASVLMGILSRDAVVEFTTTDGTATSTPPVDYTGITTNLLFNQAVTRQCVNVTITNDDILENTENFFASLTTTVPNVVLNPDRAEVEISEDPNDGVTIGFERTLYSVTEGVDASVELCAVLITGMLEREAVVMFSTSDGTATSTAPVDYGATTAEFIFDPDNSRHCVNVPIENDVILEDTENFFGSLTTTDPAVTLDPDTAQVDINEDTNDGVTIGFERTLYSTTEGEDPSVELCAVLITGTLEREAVVAFSTRDGTATSTAPIDYDGTNLDFVFDAENSIRCVNVSIVDDEILEDTENFFGTLTTTDSAVLLIPDEAEVEIIEDPDEEVTIGFERTVYIVTEGVDANVELCAVLIVGELERQAVVTFSTSDGTATATAPADYDETTVDFLFGPNNSRRCVNVTIVNDDIVEDTEDFFGSLTTTDSAVFLDPDRAQVIITEDPTDRVTIGFEQTVYTATEGTDANVEVCAIVIMGILEKEAVVSFSTMDGSAVSVAPSPDYDEIVADLTFDPTTSRVCVLVPIVNDGDFENPEDFTVILTTTDPAVELDPDTAVVQITDDDVIRITFQRPMYMFVESDGTGTVCIEKIGNTSVTITAMISGALQPELSMVIDQDVVFPPNVFVRCVDFPIADDDIALEPPQILNFSLTVIDPISDSIIVDPYASTRVVILDDDVLNITLVKPAVIPEAGGPALACAVFSGPFAQPFDLVAQSNLNVSGRAPATSGQDFGEVNTVLRAIPGQSQVCFNITIIDDDLVEFPEECFVIELTLDSPPDDVQIVDGSSLCCIVDDDEITIGFDPAFYAVLESEGTVVITVRILQGGLADGRTTNVTFTTTDGFGFSAPALQPDDYLFESQILQFSSNTTSFDISVRIVDDNVVEFDEMFLGDLTMTPADPAVILDPNRATVTIIDTSRVVIGLEQTAYSVVESIGLVEVCAILRQGSLAREVLVTLSTGDRSAVSPADYEAISEILAFDQRVNRVCRNVTITDDDIQEPPELFNLTLTTTDTGVTLDPPFGTVLIIDDDGEQILVNDTITGDPLYTVPIFVPDIENLDFEMDRVSLCYEVHGQMDQWFNLVTDECTSVNAYYTNFTDNSDPDFQLNVVNRVAVRAVDDSRTCREILIDLDGCSVELDGLPLPNPRYSQNAISIRRYPRRVRVAVPNCRERNIIMWVTCETQEITNYEGEVFVGDMLRVDVMRGLNFGHRDSHGLIGQYWNVPIDLAKFNGTQLDDTTRYVISVNRDGSLVKEFTGSFHTLVWDQTVGDCLYVGDRQGGRISEVQDPNDPVLDGSYKDYRVPSAFDETGYRFGRFQENLCQ